MAVNKEKSSLPPLLQAMQVATAAANAYQAYNAYNHFNKGGNEGTLVSAEAGVGITGSASKNNSSYSVATPSSVAGGNNVSITSTKGDVNAIGSSVKAGDTLSITSAKDINLEASSSTQQSDGKHSNYGVEVGVGASAGAKTGVYAYVAVQAGSGKYQSDSQTYSNTTLEANNAINLTSNNDTNLKGAAIKGDRLLF